MTGTVQRARAYLAKLPPAVSGAGGHNATFRAACWLVRFGLSDAEAIELLREYNSRCSPPWTEAELRHKLQNAMAAAGGPAHRLSTPAPLRTHWKAPPVPTPPKRPAPPPPVPARQELPRKPDTRTEGELPLRIVRAPETPEDFFDAIADWPAAVNHPRWRNDPGLLAAIERLRKRREAWTPPCFRFRTPET
ncbi:MAG TPA: primase C-terminal domain-containing protein [Verrucomicrobiota bacterium]|nr:primase C-terminal domain-containing protein [Verrucomicrobiota bacterium]